MTANSYRKEAGVLTSLLLLLIISLLLLRPCRSEAIACCPPENIDSIPQPDASLSSEAEHPFLYQGEPQVHDDGPRKDNGNIQPPIVDTVVKLLPDAPLPFPRPSRGCTGSADCRVCKNCKYCKYCSKMGGTCGVCR